MRPAWARSWRCKSSRELTTANEVKRNCVRVTDRGEEAWSEAVSRWTRTGYEAMPSRPMTAKLLWSRLRQRKSGGCAVKDRVLTWGCLALCLKGRWCWPEREVSRGHSSCKAKGRRNRRVSHLVLGFGMSQMFAEAKLARRVCRVKPEGSWQRETELGGSETSNLRRRAGICSSAPTSTIPTARCGPACRVVWEGLGQFS